MKNVHPRWSKELRCDLRQRMTRAEKLFWYQIRNAEGEMRFIRRQVGIGRFVVDFLHPKSKVVIEIDGVTHFSETEKTYDALRTKWLEEQGYFVIRFSNQEVFDDLETIFQKIISTINILLQQKKAPQASPLLARLKGRERLGEGSERSPNAQNP